jgi:hypothetical protein
MSTDGKTREIERLAVRPDAQHGTDRPFAKTDRKIGIIRISRCVRGNGRTSAHALPAARCLRRCADHLLEIGRPYDLARQTRAAIDARDRRTLGGRHYRKIGEARAFLHDLLPASEQGTIDRIAGKRTDEAACYGAGGSKHRFACGSAGD